MNAGRRTFLLSPANSAGKRAGMLLRPEANFELALRLRERGAPLGDLYAFMSGLYFRGKLQYARAFGASAHIITPVRGLVAPETIVSSAELRGFASVAIDAEEPLYREPLERDARALASLGGEVVLLGSVATGKYLEPLLDIFGERLLFPSDFAGRGDMSRGGLMLRAAESGVELAYAPALTGIRHGKRPPRLPALSRV